MGARASAIASRAKCGAIRSDTERGEALDFDDLILLPVRLLENIGCSRACAERWKYIHIDDTDTNELQGRLAGMCRQTKYFVVGDMIRLLLPGVCDDRELARI